MANSCMKMVKRSDAKYYVASVLVLLLFLGLGLQRTQKASDDVKRMLEETRKARARMEENKESVARTCHAYRDNMADTYKEFYKSGYDKTTNTFRDQNVNFLVSEDSHIGWCKLHKVASSSFVRSLLLVIGRSDIVETVPRFFRRPHLKRLMPPYPGPWTNPEGFTTFMAVRHPFTRVLSAYREKIANPNDPEVADQFSFYRDEYNAPIIQKYRKVNNSDEFFREIPTFEEFIDYLADTAAAKYEKHWRPFFLVCTPCHINYTAIVRVEAWPRDIQDLVNLTGYPELNAGFLHVSESKTNATAEYFSKIPKYKLERLYHAYEIDFKMFGYDPTPFYELGVA